MSQLEVDKIIPQSGTTLTIGETGDTISFASGVLPSLESLTITGDLTVDTNTLYVDSTNNNVGIGTTSQANKLEVSGAIVSQGAVDSYTNDGLYLSNEGSSIFKIGAWRSGASASILTFGTDSGSDTAPVERMRIDSSGNVGIGTTSPVNLLNIKTTETFDPTAPQATSGIFIEQTGGTFGNGNFSTGITISKINSGRPYGAIAGLQTGADEDQGGLAFFTSGGTSSSDTLSERMRIDSSGKVGIDTTSPSQHLQVGSGTADTRATFRPNNTFAIGFANGGNFGGWIGAAGTDILVFSSSGGAERMRIDSSGNVNINGTGGTRSLNVLGTTNAYMSFDATTYTKFTVGSESSGFIIFDDDASAYRLAIDSSGNVGIGTTSPLSKLDVLGPSSVTSFTGTSHLGLTVRGSSGGTDYSGIDFIGNNQVNPIARVGVLSTGSGTSLSFGTSNNYGSGITNTAMTIDQIGRVGIGTTSPSVNLAISDALAPKIRFSRGASYFWNIGHTSSDFQFESQTGGVIMHMNFDGNVGIGTTSPSTKLEVNGSLSKSSGSFKIPHPLPEKTDTHHLVHSFVEAPQADNIYRGKVDLVNGTATVNIDTVAGMTEGTFVLLNREIQCFTSNETGWTAVRGSVSGNILTITAQDETCTDTISWLVIGERQDQHMYDTEWTDENGKVIVEPLKPVEEELTLEDE